MARNNAIPAEKLADIPIDQLPDLDGDVLTRESPIVRAEHMPPKQWAEDMAFMEEPVTIRIEPSSEKNAAQWFSAMVNGKGAEVRQPDGRWMEMTEGYLPVGMMITIKRKYLEVILRAKVDVINIANTDTHDVDQGRANKVQRSTTPVHGISIISDPSPKGQQWAEETRRRYM